MEQQNLAKKIHSMTNKLQVVLGWVELENLPKALLATNAAIEDLHKFQGDILERVKTIPIDLKDELVIVPPDTEVASAQNVTISTPAGDTKPSQTAVTVAPKVTVKKRKGHGAS